MCDGNVCSCLEIESQDDNCSFIEFVTNLKHEKCKVIQLVREQIHKFEDTEDSESRCHCTQQILSIGSSTHDNMSQYEMECESLVKEDNRAEKMPVSLLRSVSQEAMPPRTRLGRVYSRLCSRFTLVILLIGTLLLLMACGGFLKVLLCGSSPIYSTPFKYFYAKRIVF